MGIPVEALPDDSVWLVYAFNVSLSLVNQQLAAIPGPIYMLAVYNLGGANLIAWAQDVSPVFVYPDPVANPNGLGYFAFLRSSAGFGVGTMILGIVSSSSDEGTSSSLEIPEQLKNLSLADLQLLQTPYGRTYLSFASKAGSLWGLS